MTKMLTAVIIFISSLMIIESSAEEFDKSKLPKLLGASNAGTEFYFTFLPCWETTGGSSYLKIYVSSSVETEVTVSIEGKDFTRTKRAIPNDIIEFYITPEIGLVHRKTPWEAPIPERVWEKSAVHVTAGAPIICYAVTRYQYTSDGFLALPVQALGKEYIVSSYDDPTGINSMFLPSYTSVVAPYDETKISFTMGGNSGSKTAGGLLPGGNTTFNMNKGDVVLIGGIGLNADLSGSKIESTKPVAVVSGHFCAYIPTNTGCCDFLIEQELPTNTWGTEYHVTPIHGRKKSSIIKIYAKEAMTKIFRDYQEIGLLKTSGGIKGEGFIEIRASEDKPKPIVISGDKPIGVTQYNTGQLDDGVVSDPFQMVLQPTEQYQNDITFNTPGIRGGFGFTVNNINLCYPADIDGILPYDIEFGFFENDELKWVRLVDQSPKPGEPFARDNESNKYYSKTITLPGDGVYKLRAQRQFAAYSYGFSYCDSYGFPTAGSFIENRADLIPPALNYDISKSGTIKGNVNANLNGSNSALSLALLYQPESYNYEFKTSEFIPGTDYSTDWELNVTDPSKDAKAIIIFADKSGNDTIMVFEYDAVTGVNDSPINMDLITLYPQPATDLLNISYDNPKDSYLTISITDLNGKLVKEISNNDFKPAGKQNLQYNLSGLTSGTYILQISSEKGILSKKFVKE
jgi:hypothetical protein